MTEILLGHSLESRNPENEILVPDFRRDDVWTPAFAGVTEFERFARI
jgi:hypothetical protein